MNANQTYDFIIVGSGAGGIPAAAKLAESGKKVLLIERGPASSGRHGGTMKPDWLSGTNLTRFDVPGLDNEIWVNSEGVACTDYSVMAGCVLGGGTAVNAGLWWNPDPLDFDEGFPEGWKHADIEPAISRAFEKIPYNERPSKDGELYKAQGYNIVGTLSSRSHDYKSSRMLTCDLSSWCTRGRRMAKRLRRCAACREEPHLLPPQPHVLQR
jgi:cellobiose dehydrogenase (acceptor)